MTWHSCHNRLVSWYARRRTRIASLLSPPSAEPRINLKTSELLLTKFATAIAFWLAKLKPNQLVRILAGVVVRDGDATLSEVRHVRDAINSVSARRAGNGCLQRSIAMMLLARFYSIPLVWRSGFHINPFVAHAWVLFDNRPVGETLNLSEFMISLQAGGKT